MPESPSTKIEVAPRDLLERLENSRSQIEGRFARAGEALENALTVIGRQIEALAQLGAVLDPTAVHDATQVLSETASHLHALPHAVRTRVDRLGDFNRKSCALGVHAEEMRDYLKFLRAFALNLKIVAGGTASAETLFQGFAQEMIVRLDEGGEILDRFSAHLSALQQQIENAVAFEGNLDELAGQMIPSAPNQLSADAEAINQYHQNMLKTTAEVSALAQKLQQHVLSALSALQIGDISRQRIEHVQSSLKFLTDSEARLAASGQDQSRKRLRQIIHALLAEQLTDTAAELNQNVSLLQQNIESVATLSERLLEAQRQGNASKAGNSALRSLEKSVGEAIVLVQGMDQATANANVLQKTTTSAIESLVAHVGDLRLVKEDMRFMAINTTLRCARMGDAGKPLQVVAQELRFYGDKLELAADFTVSALTQLANEAKASASQTAETNTGAQAQLNAALSHLRQAANLVDSDLANASAQGSGLAASLAQATYAIDFKSSFGDILEDVAIGLVDDANLEDSDTSEIEEPLAYLLDRIAALYTMAKERQIHAKFARHKTSSDVTPPAPIIASDDDALMAAALF